MTTGPVEFLTAFAQALSALALYPPGHRTREQAVDSSYQRLRDLLESDDRPEFSFLGDDVLYGNLPIRELRTWDWSKKLAATGIQRIQFDRTTSRADLEEFLDAALAHLTLRSIDTSEARQTRPSGIKFGLVGVRGEDPAAQQDEIATATIAFTLSEEADAVRWIHEQLSMDRQLPLVDAEAVVRALSVAMHGDQEVMLPLLQLRTFDEYTTTHSLNVSVLAMALAEWLGMGARDVRTFGVAGLLHDLGKVRIPKEILTKPGKLTDDERREMNRHPVEGARIILGTQQDLDLAAIVAYEHHVMLNGGGYPSFRYPRDCHHASKLVHICDVYDALRTKRPYRDAWPAEKVLSYVGEGAGREFDPTLTKAFVDMMREWEPRIAALTEDQPLPA